MLPGEYPAEGCAESGTCSHTDPENAVYPVHLSGTVVLGDKTDSRPIEALNDEISIVFKVERGRRTGYGICSVTVDRRLYHYV